MASTAQIVQNPSTTGTTDLNLSSEAFPSPASAPHYSGVSRRLQLAVAGLMLLIGGCTAAHRSNPDLEDKPAQNTTMTNSKDSPPAGVRSIQGAVYPLDGGSEVIVHQPFGKEYYSAVVKMDGEYPGPGKIAVDQGREEFIYVLDGAFTVTINKQDFQLGSGENIIVHDGDSYYLKGSGRCMVVVHDLPGGKTAILPSK